MRRRRILVLSAHTGAGHFAAGVALAEAAEAFAASGLEILTLDAFDPQGLQTVLHAPRTLQNAEHRHGEVQPDPPSIADRLVASYAPVIVRAPWLWGAVFKATDNAAGIHLTSLLGGTDIAHRIARAIEILEPTALVTVHPLLTGVAGMARQFAAQHAKPLPLLAVVTDLVTVHRLWASPLTDHWTVGSSLAAEALLQHGVPSGRIHRLGVPVRAAFGTINLSAREQRRHLNLHPDQPLLLLMGGGEGAGGLQRMAAALGTLVPSAQLMVVTGRHVGLRRHLEARSWPGTTRVLGFVDNVAELMTAADVLITKPGSMTIAEACATGRPMVLLPPVPGQEDGNVEYVVDAGAGLAVRRPTEAVDAVKFLLNSPAETWEMGQRAARLGQPRAAQRTLDFVQSLVLESESARAYGPGDA